MHYRMTKYHSGRHFQAFFYSVFNLERRNLIKCNLAKMMGEKKMKVSDVAKLTNLHRNTITLLYKEQATRIEIEAIDKLCDLFECNVGDLFEKVKKP